MSKKTATIRTSKTPDKIFDDYKLACLGLKNASNDAVVVTPREADMKQAKEWMTKTKKGAEFKLTFDGTWLSLDVYVGTNKDSIVTLKLTEERDKKKLRQTLVGLHAAFPKVVGQDDLDAFDAANIDPAELAKLKQEITDKTAEVQKLEGQLKTAKEALVKMQTHYKAVGGK